MTYNLNFAEIELITEALAARASRHESMGRANPRGAGSHDRTADAMRKLREKLLRQSDRP